MADLLRRATREDVSTILDIAEMNRSDDQRYQATFWRRAGSTREQQTAALEARLSDVRVVAYVHEADGSVDGFVFATVLSAPPVYDPGGPVALIDDFALRNPNSWSTVGAALLHAAAPAAREKGAVLTTVVAEHQDGMKYALLNGAGYSLASEWHLRHLNPDDEATADDADIRPAEVGDLGVLLELAEQRRIQYQSYQPVFWRNAPDAREKQGSFLERSLRTGSGVALVHEREGRVDGFVIGNLLSSPPVYALDQITCLIDDFHVASPDAWSNVGTTLLRSANREAKKRGAAQTAVICGHLDQPKRQMLLSAGSVISSEWWVKVW